jgi:nuclear pore complex protein Nup107
LVLLTSLTEPASGNPYRDIWKAMTWNECENSNLLPEERAIFGLLCSNLKSLLPACQSWEDHLWAYLRAMIDRSVEKELRRCVNYKRQLEVLSDEYWGQQLTIESIFAMLAACRDKNIVNQGRDHYRY